MILFHVSITSSAEVRVCQKLYAYVPLHNRLKYYQLWLGNFYVRQLPKNKNFNITESSLQFLKYIKRLPGKIQENILHVFVSHGIKTIVWIFPVYHCYVVYVTNIGYVVSISTYLLHHFIKCACKIA